MKDEFVMVPRSELVRLQENLDPHRGAVAWGIVCDLLALPHHGEPVALPARKPYEESFSVHGQGQAMGWNACLDEIAKLGPLYTHADPGEPVIHPINMKTLMQAYEQQGHRALLHGTSNWCAAMATALRGVLCSGPSAPVERDERAELKPDAWRASINGDWEYFRSYEQALKELREWQSDYLPEELEEAKADGLCEPEPVYSRAARGRKP